MQITATFSQSELERLVSAALKSERPELFQHGASVYFDVTEGQRDGFTVTARATPASYVQPKD